jgi:hypothetical protein
MEIHSTLTFAWGVVATLMGVTQSKTGFWIVRFFLGVAESGLFPGMAKCLLRTNQELIESKALYSISPSGINAMKGNFE